MGRRLVLALLLAGWLFGALGCGPSKPVEQSKPFKQLRSLPQEPTKG